MAEWSKVEGTLWEPSFYERRYISECMCAQPSKYYTYTWSMIWCLANGVLNKCAWKEQRRSWCIRGCEPVAIFLPYSSRLSMSMTVRTNCSTSSFHYIKSCSCHIIKIIVFNLLCNPISFLKFWLSRQWELLSPFYRWNHSSSEARYKLTQVLMARLETKLKFSASKPSSDLIL